MKSNDDCFNSVFFYYHLTALLIQYLSILTSYKNKTASYTYFLHALQSLLYNIYPSMIRFPLREIKFILQLFRSDEAMEEYYPTICLSCFI